MLTTIKGYYENGQVTFKEEPPVKEKTEVIVTFLTEESVNPKKKRVLGALKGKITIPDDFNGQVDEDLKEHEHMKQSILKRKNKAISKYL